MVKKIYRCTSSAARVEVSLIPDTDDRRLCTIQKNARALELAIPFPCKKSAAEVHEMKDGQETRMMISFFITLRNDAFKNEITLDAAQKFLEGAGFQNTWN